MSGLSDKDTDLTRALRELTIFEHDNRTWQASSITAFAQLICRRFEKEGVDIGPDAPVGTRIDYALICAHVRGASFNRGRAEEPDNSKYAASYRREHTRHAVHIAELRQGRRNLVLYKLAMNP